MKTAIVIGSGFAGLSAAASLAQEGYEVTVLEKNSQAGGRARQFKENGFVFDMGPSWYWMPDVFEKYFAKFGKKVSDFYQLDRLDPSYQVIYTMEDTLKIPAQLEPLYQLFEKEEPGSSQFLKKFLKDAAYKYEVGMNSLVYKPSRSLREFADLRLLNGILKMDVFSSISSGIRKNLKSDKLIQLLEFPVLFLGAKPEKTPALYSLMNYADLALGTWYPQGGMHKIIEAMVSIAEEQGVTIELNANVDKIEVENGVAKGVRVNGTLKMADVVVAGADYHHVETQLLEKKYRNYSEDYWDKRVMAPSSLLFYLGVDREIPKLLHHNLFFDEPFGPHANEIYENPKWPSKPLFYASVPSKTDKTVAPAGKENLFLLVPVAPDLKDTEEIREKYYHQIMDRLEKYTGVTIRDKVVYKRSFAHADFISDYNAFKGNAYGLANTLKQTAILKPSLKNKKVSNVYYTGQLTVPGPGVPPSIISGQVVAREIVNDQKI